MDMTQTVEQLVRELLKSIPAAKKPSPQVLFVLDESCAADRCLDHFLILKQAGIEHDLLVLDGETSGWLGSHCIECTGAGKCIATDEFAPAPIELPRSYAAVIIPELDLDQASRISLGLKGTVVSELVLAALLLNKPVFTRADGSGICRSDRRTLQITALPPAYDRRYRSLMQELKALGIHMADFNALAELVIAELMPERAETEGLLLSKPAPSVFRGRLLTASDASQLLRMQGGGVLMVAQGTLISPLARDVLREHRAELRFIDEVNSDVSR